MTSLLPLKKVIRLLHNYIVKGFKINCMASSQIRVKIQFLVLSRIMYTDRKLFVTKELQSTCQKVGYTIKTRFIREEIVPDS